MMRITVTVGVAAVLTILALVGGAAAGSDALGLELSADGGFTATVGGEPWLWAAPGLGVQVVVNGQLYEAGKNLRLVNKTVGSGSDAVGDYDETAFAWAAGAVPWVTSYRFYANRNAVVFEQTWPEGANGTSVGDPNGVSSIFPAVAIGGATDRGYYSYQGNMAWYDQWGVFGNGTEKVGNGGGLNGTGPLILFNEDNSVCSVLSAFSNFMTVNEVSVAAGGGHALALGLLGTVTEVPPGYSISTVLSVGGKGINKEVHAWGKLLLDYYGKTKDRMEADFTLNFLGYYTDNGAYYYYNTEEGKTYGETIRDIKAYAVEQDLPFQFVQLDSWWYYKGVDDGVKNWTAITSVFPDGMVDLFAATEWPVVAHNRYWSANTDYATQNGGEFDFLIDETDGFAIPTEEAFWSYLIGSSLDWGLTVYEQDWLFNEFIGANFTLLSPTLARQWLLQMGAGAEEHGVNIQYCMPYPRHVLQSVEVPAVTQIRSSNDYHLAFNQWDIGVTSMLMSAVGLAPFKDTFWSTSVQPGNPYNKTEPFPALEALVATLSTASVAPSDRIGYVNKTLVMMSCAANGRLLQPDRPATLIDTSVVALAFPGSGPPGYIWSTETSFLGLDWHVIAAIELSHAYALQVGELNHQNGNPPPLVAFERGNQGTDGLVSFDASSPLNLDPVTKANFTVWHAAPVLSNGWAVLGETAKWVPVSRARIEQFLVKDTTVVLGLTGTPGEAVTISFAKQDGSAWQWIDVPCVLSDGGSAMLDAAAGSCM